VRSGPASVSVRASRAALASVFKLAPLRPPPIERFEPASASPRTRPLTRTQVSVPGTGAKPAPCAAQMFGPWCALRGGSRAREGDQQAGETGAKQHGETPFVAACS
jgi:hypothetical protein